MEKEFICIWLEKVEHIAIIDRRTGFVKSTDQDIRSVAKWRFVHIRKQIAKNKNIVGPPSQPESSLDELLPWPHFHRHDLPIVIPDLYTHLDIYDFSVTNNKQNADLIPAPNQNTFKLDPNLTINNEMAGCWVICRMPHGINNVESLFENATLISASHLNEILKGDNDLNSRIEKIIDFTVETNGFGGRNLNFWISPFSGDRIGPSVHYKSQVINSFIEVEVEFKSYPQKGHQPNIQLMTTDNTPVHNLASDLEGVHWRRAAAALNRLPEVSFSKTTLSKEIYGTPSKLSIDFNNPILNGDVFGVISRDNSVSLSQSDFIEDSDSYESGSYGTNTALFLRREAGCEILSDNDPIKNHIDKTIAKLEILPPENVPDYNIFMQQMRQRLHRFAEITSYLKPITNILETQQKILEIINKAKGIRLDRFAYIAACPHRMHEVLTSHSANLPEVKVSPENIYPIILSVLLKAYSVKATNAPNFKKSNDLNAYIATSRALMEPTTQRDISKALEYQAVNS